jgi:glycosyltransferase involved in cell wall biosynthesis
MSGEKNFYLKLLPLIRSQFDDLIVISVNDQDSMYTHNTDSGSIPIYNFSRPLHRGNKSRFLKIVNNTHCYHHRHGPIQEMLEKFLTLYINKRKIRNIFENHNIDVIYFMDNFGFGMGYLCKTLSKKTVFAAANYDPRGHFYDRVQKYFLSKLDLIITYSHAYKNILSKLGINNHNISVLHWGISPYTLSPLDDSIKQETKKLHNIKHNNMLILWTGYIQQIQEIDFYLSTSVAKEICKKRSNVQFIFCFKPETFKSKYKDEETDGIQIISGAPNFHNLLGSADLLFSPTYKLSSTVSPPLTWTEAMSMGVPVITTNVKGADEIIDHLVDGYITDNYDTIIADTLSIIDRGIDKNIKHNARKKIIKDYNIHNIANDFVTELGVIHD